jgi:hypothetical protein
LWTFFDCFTRFETANPKRYFCLRIGLEDLQATIVFQAEFSSGKKSKTGGESNNTEFVTWP